MSVFKAAAAEGCVSSLNLRRVLTGLGGKSSVLCIVVNYASHSSESLA